MAKEKSPSYKSFGSIPRDKFASEAAKYGNKTASFKEDMYTRPMESDDAVEYGNLPPESAVQKQVTESSEVASLRKRIEYYTNDSLEDPKVRMIQLRQLEARLQEALKQDQQEAVPSSDGSTADPEAKKTGWWNTDFRNKQQETLVDEEVVLPALPTNKDPQQMKDQMARLVKKTTHLREEAGLSASDALEESPDYKALKSEISRVRYRLNKILEEKGKEEYKEEIIQLRHELAEHLVAFKKFSREKVKENDGEGGSNTYPSLTKEEEIDAKNLEGLSAALQNAPVQVSPEAPVSPDTESKPGPAPVEIKEYESRLLVRKEWQEKKETYLNAYEQHLSDVKNKKAQANMLSKMAFWKKDEQPQSLVDAEQAYQDARRKYAGLLNGALDNRASTQRGGDLEGYQAGLANRFVLLAAHEKLAKEKEYLPDAKSLRVFEKMQSVLKEHKRLIKVSGYVAVAGIGLVSAGVGAAIVALGSKAVGAKLATLGAAGGSTIGAYLGNSLSNTVIDYTANRRDSAAQRAQRKWSLETMDAREKEYAGRYRSHESALRDKNFYIGVGTLAGGAAGAIALGNIDNLNDIEVPDTAPVVPPLPPTPDWTEQLSPSPDFGTVTTPGEVIEEELEESLTAEPLPAEAEEPKSIENVEKDDSLKNVPTEGPSDDVTYFEPRVPDSEPMLYDPAPHLEPYLETPQTEEIEEVPEVEAPELLHTFEPGDKVDTVSEALFEAWKQDNDTLEESVTKKEFLAEMYGAIAEIEKNPTLNAELMEQMGIESGDIDKVRVGDTVDLQPFFQYMNQRN
jgi:hypothetical protein